MIFLTIGTHEPFDRLVSAVDEWCRSRQCGDLVFGQITDRAGYEPTSYRWVAKLDPASFREECADADLIVSHAGMGSIITAMSLGRPLVVLPRRAHLGETRNDHQQATAERFAGRPGIYVAMTELELPTLLDRLVGEPVGALEATIRPFAEGEIVAALEDFIHRG